MDSRTYYQVFVDSVWGSDVVECDTLKEAREAAINWRKDLKKDQNKVVILKVTEKLVEEI